MIIEIRIYRFEYIYYKIFNFIGWSKFNWLVIDNFYKFLKDW